MSIKLDMLKCFATVARHGSLSEAANTLGRTPSAVSMMLKQFEDHIGSPLFETARKSKLTALGELIYQEARREVQHFEKTISVIEGLSRAEVGTLRLAVTPSVATTILPKVILAYTDRFPDVQIDIRDMDSASIAQELTRERVDVGIGTLPPSEYLTRLELFSDPFGVVCRKDDPLARDWTRLTWRTMDGLPLIANGLCDKITDPDFVDLLAKSHMNVPSTTTLLSLVRQGVGITVLPKLVISDLHDDLVFLPLVDISTRRTVYIASPPMNVLMPTAKAFVSLIMDLKQSGALTAPY